MTDTLFNEIEPEFCDMSAWDYFCEMTALATELESDLTAAREEIERLQCSGIHSCHDNCERPNCVLRREIKILTEQRDGLRSGIDYASDQLSKVTEQRDRLAETIRLTLMENLDLCDGEICTLKRLKDAIGFDQPLNQTEP